MQLAELIHRWPPTVINHMTWRQREIERMRSVVKTECKQNNLRPCTFCGASIKTDMYHHVARCHLQLAQLWRCLVPWCTMWKGTPQDLMTHILEGHNVPGKPGELVYRSFSLHGLSHENSMKNPYRLKVRAFRMTYCCLARWD